MWLRSDEVEILPKITKKRFFAIFGQQIYFCFNGLKCSTGSASWDVPQPP
jgi:hypothetical protein